jgi:D-alanine-D-alanine ligase
MKRRGKRCRVLVLLDEDQIPPESLNGADPKTMASWRMEYDVLAALRQCGHELLLLPLSNDLTPIRPAIEAFRPHIACNLLEEFSRSSTMVQNVVGYLELLKMQYTGCNPRGLMLAFDKALSKKILAYHRIPVPQLTLFPKRHRFRRGVKYRYPLLVKPLFYEGSVGITQASVVHDEDHLVDRIEHIHRTFDDDALAEQFIEGREIYVGVLGNARLETFTPWELLIENLPDGVPNIATKKVKWDLAYQKRAGVVTKPAEGLTEEQLEMIDHVSKRIYRLLGLSGYARLDFRLRPDGRLFLIEANPNPNMCEEEDYAQSAKHCGVSYPELWSRIVNLGRRYEYVNLP